MSNQFTFGNSLIKMLYSMCIRKKRLPMPPELENAIRRNFGGKDGYDPTVVFKKRKVLPTRVSMLSRSHSHMCLDMYRYLPNCLF